ncbi:uncharacterized protein DEA37_0005292 [Paragonimus westermani]|uniref:PEST proteolytic signal-containing nuclear protein n=1 Tax=Paragonimus westermani TaxID=34504 RepID=A0A5J4NEC9_9TREM|nr:uncharacterized protein DEA37_0005292 [Paragonimus westermani]
MDDVLIHDIPANIRLEADVALVSGEVKFRYTPTSCGPNSYGKGKFGFIDRRALLNRQTEAINEYLSEDNT